MLSRILWSHHFAVITLCMLFGNEEAFVIPVPVAIQLSPEGAVTLARSSCNGRTFAVTPTPASFLSSLCTTTTMFSTQQPLSNNDDSEDTSMLSLTLSKPLGIILEEVQEGQSFGVKVAQLLDSGSAYDCRDKLMGTKVVRVMGVDVTEMNFDSVMEQIISAPSPVMIEFEVGSLNDGLEVGTEVTLTILQHDDKKMEITGKVGDNLRITLLENNVELYRGLKRKLGNCGGGGSCTFCAVNFVKFGPEWSDRSEYEDVKLGKKYPKSARLACQNTIEGPATIRLQ